MISATAWVRKGAAAPEPRRARVSAAEYDAIMARAGASDSSEGEDGGPASAPPAKEKPASLAAATPAEDAVHDDLARFHLETYSDEDGPQVADAPADDFASDEEDDASDEDPEDADDLHIRPTDSLVVCCRTEDDVSCLEMHVYEEDVDNLYIHHDVLLPSFPLAVEWLNTPLGSASAGGNYAAVATFEPEIEVWDLDVLEPPYATLVLGARGDARKRLAKLRRGDAPVPPAATHHVDAVMSLSWNTQHRAILASGSADATVKVWDLVASLAGAGAAHSFGALHAGKVQALQWAPGCASLLASAGYDRAVRVTDCRTAGDGASWTLAADPEALRWCPTRLGGTAHLAVSDEDGRVLILDVRRPGVPLTVLQAHAKAVTALDWNPTLADCLLTLSADRSVRLWHAPAAGEPRCVAERSVAGAVGKAFSGSFSPDRPHLAVVAGSKGRPAVLNLLQDASVVSAWPVPIA